MKSPSPSPSKTTVYLGCIATLAVLWGLLFFWFPYTAGYLFTDKSLFSFVRSGWASGEGQWEHCIFVPFIAAGLIWWKRKKLAELPITPANAGLLILAGAMLAYWAGYAVDQRYLGYAGLQLMTAAVAIWFLGWSQFRALFAF